MQRIEKSLLVGLPSTEAPATEAKDGTLSTMLTRCVHLVDPASPLCTVCCLKSTFIHQFDEFFINHLLLLACIRTPPTGPRVRLDYAWRVERNKMRGMGVDSWTAKITATYQNDNDRNGKNSPATTITILDANDCVSEVDAEAFAELCERIGLPWDRSNSLALSLQARVWLLSFMGTHPSDFAFDAISMALANAENPN